MERCLGVTTVIKVNSSIFRQLSLELLSSYHPKAKVVMIMLLPWGHLAARPLSNASYAFPKLMLSMDAT